MRTVFMGTPNFAVPCLGVLIRHSEIELCGVVTQPDRPKGRGQHDMYPPVKEQALKHDLMVYQPHSGKDKGFMDVLLKLKPELIIVVAYGIILRDEVLKLPLHGCINVHASLLPKYRGASPIQQCIIDGCHQSGVTTMRMNEGLDTGDMIVQLKIDLAANETSATLHDKLSELGAAALKQTINQLIDGSVVYTPQNHDEATYAPKLHKKSGQIDWTKNAREIDAFIRGVQPWPSAYTLYKGNRLKIWQAVAHEDSVNVKPGTIIKADKESFQVATGKGVLLVKEIQLDGKRRMNIDDFLKGNQIDVGVELGV